MCVAYNKVRLDELILDDEAGGRVACSDSEGHGHAGIHGLTGLILRKTLLTI